jgi:long-chain fatty acid transport protein
MLHWMPKAGLILALLLSATTASAQSSVQVPLQLDFVNPGAKSLALGGAFVGLADDATAGFANPAGLRELGAPELSVELRGGWLQSGFLERGRLSGTVLNEKEDVIAGPVFGTSSDNHAGVSYLAAVFPFPRQRVVIAGFRHELARVDQHYFSQGVFQQDPTELTSRRQQPQDGVRQIEITNYGIAGAVEINPRVAVGATFSVYNFHLLSDFRRFDTVGFLGPPNLNVEFGRSTQEGSGVGFGPGVGLRVCLKPCQDREKTSTRFGAVYRHGPSFDFDTVSGSLQRSGNQFRVPDALAVGGALEIPRPGRRLLLTGEVTRITYSRLIDDFVGDQVIDSGLSGRFAVPDGTEVHLGVQYTLEGPAWLPRLRGGVWSDPDHSTKFIAGPPAQTPDDRLTDEVLTVSLSLGKRRTHYAGGLGLTFSPRLEWNFGADHASDNTVVSTSVIVKLGR